MEQDIILGKLNPQQKKAVMCTEGPLLVFAGAGSGKTRVITNRIAYLIAVKGVKPENILAVTFTKKASGEMLERVRKLLKDLNRDVTDLPMIGTFHSIGATLLRRKAQEVGLLHNFSIYDSDDSENLIREIMLEMQIDIKQIKPKAIAHFIEAAKNDMVTPAQFSNHFGGYIEDIAAQIYPVYQNQLKAQNSVDFGDLLFLTVKMLEENEEVRKYYQDKYKYILIDEYQDTNNAQYRFAKLLSEKHQNICVVGDDDQGIYAWRGADIKNIQSFEKDFKNVTVIKLEQNYRSTKNVIEAAVSVIQQNNQRIVKNLWTENNQGETITVYQARDQEEEAEYVVENIRHLRDLMIPLSNVAVLYRTNYQSRAIEEAMLKEGIPYKLVGGFRFYERKEVKDIISYLRFMYNLKDELSLSRILNIPTRKMGPKAVKSLHKLAKECTCTIGEFLVGAFVVLNPEYKHLCDIREISMSKISELQTEFEKLKLVINLFGTLYFQSKEKDVLELIDIILERTKYIQWFDDGTEQSDMKKENITELKNVAYTYVSKFGKQSLEMFLNEINLIEQEQDKNQDGSGNYVNLMTLHSSKGLEFDYVFLIGMEEGLLPHSRAFIEEKELEEERRLCYVGITRAKQKLFLTFAENRLTREGYSTQLPSRFLGEIPQNLCEYFSWNA
ncbi:MAG TPA: UvrD-helicase domain-containing protein [Candidatus Dojkabacteria bacterium]|nr:UvrD-helicase domain-containing protein [Candidatus Dojkabacteria bacterium]HOF78947.1 UvrD-helicase domain-containing protein [Candidatus Dojkabacteria bacterium]HOR06109.1 UvrD-helicase domain-containing protein [Candidatus Dojkabacteria bacterium]HOT60877.1 UvrD-helicase domain-containing protein [Candidatus Dojkabacteria bacterium]HQI92673.1 UvrD-helicase domain-containing protein [Candidatus Dojkabacteria bacterium]